MKSSIVVHIDPCGLDHLAHEPQGLAIGLRVLALRADVEGHADLAASLGRRLEQIGRVLRLDAELRGQMIHRALVRRRLDADDHRQVRTPGFLEDLLELAFVIDHEMADAEDLISAPDDRAPFDRMHEIGGGVRVGLADLRDLRQRGGIEMAHAAAVERIEDERMRVAFYGIENRAGERRQKAARVFLQHFRAHAINRITGRECHGDRWHIGKDPVLATPDGDRHRTPPGYALDRLPASVRIASQHDNAIAGRSR